MNETGASTAFHFLQDIAADLARGEVTFPTFTQATMRIRQTLDRPEVDADAIAHAVSGEPLLAAKLVRLANSAAMNPGGKLVGDVKSAVVRLGHTTVRSASVVIALGRLRDRYTRPAHTQLAQGVCNHSVRVASLAWVIARRMTRINPDEAMFAGLVHDIGHFYLLAQASKYAELDSDADSLSLLHADWHPSIGRAVLHDFALADGVLDAVAEHEHAHYRLPLRTVPDVVTVANLVTAATNPAACYRAVPAGKLAEPELAGALDGMRAEAEALAVALRS